MSYVPVAFERKAGRADTIAKGVAWALIAAFRILRCKLLHIASEVINQLKNGVDLHAYMRLTAPSG